MSDPWISTIDLKCRRSDRDKKTVLYCRKHTGPLMVQHPFYPEGEKKSCHIYLLYPPGGIVGGDKLFVNLYMNKNTKVLLTMPSITKFYFSKSSKSSSLTQYFFLEEKATLEFLPPETLLFPGAYAEITTYFYIQKNSKIIAWDNLSFGRTVLKEPFYKGNCNYQLQIWQSDILLLYEKLCISNGDLSIINHYPLLSTLIATPANEQLLNIVRKIIYNKRIIAGATLLDSSLLVVRMLCNNDHYLRTILYKLWDVLRPEIIGDISFPPRIWFT
ncbi:urease accessory protein UreD [Candidatus Schneideria nysicola]|uniref:urease accessory protein UreD n=1 Tax=Candidatus Schneideria nysicola TaxID=1081631 RepID=UPI001CAA78FA|nr:urease accessory protein UreD [Candidatus Schneideria nysicola]UAJ65217.1 urease accessory protein UreD [Candidatus Schneideria nysicola]